MYLETWMIVLLILSFGVCAYYSRRTGFILGATVTIETLEREHFIKLLDDGTVKRWTPYDNVRVKKTTRKKKKDI
jgi:hypothetical protein